MALTEDGSLARDAGARESGGLRVPLALALGVLALLAGMLASDAADGHGGAAASAPDGARIASVRAYQGGAWTLPGETAASVGAALARLQPTYVSSLIRFQAGEKVTNKEVTAWNTVRDAVRAVVPEAKFAIELNGLEYPSAAKVEAMMARVRGRFDNDGWLFDFYTPAAKKYPKAMEAAVQSAHDNGEYLGGNAFGIAKKVAIPAGTDYLAVQAFHFKIDLNAVRRLAKRVPVFFHLGNSPGIASSDGCVFIQKFSTAKRQAYVRKRAGQQAKYDFRFAYPVFFPECQRKRNTQHPELYSYNASKDGPMLDTIDQLMDRYEGG